MIFHIIILLLVCRKLVSCAHASESITQATGPRWGSLDQAGPRMTSAYVDMLALAVWALRGCFRDHLMGGDHLPASAEAGNTILSSRYAVLGQGDRDGWTSPACLSRDREHDSVPSHASRVPCRRQDTSA